MSLLDSVKETGKSELNVIQSSSSALENVLTECVASFFYREQKPVSLDCHMHTYASLM